ncbi:MAG: hypothetical protein AAF525_15495 [Pseudomonadota bacterium]
MLALTGCGISITRYSEGPLTEYLSSPLPVIEHPIAQSVSLETIDYNTAAGLKGMMISDLVAAETYVLPKSTGRESREALALDEPISEESILKALNIIARDRAKARSAMGLGKLGDVTTVQNDNSVNQYVEQQQQAAEEAWEKGDYLQGNIHSSAASNSLLIQQSAARTQAAAGLMFATLDAMAAAGEVLRTTEYLNLRNWLITQSGAISPDADDGNHLSVFLLRFFDAQKFKLDSRSRIVVYAVLTDAQGVQYPVLEASDFMVCQNECDQYGLRSTTTPMAFDGHHPDIQDRFFTPEGGKALDRSGFAFHIGYFDSLLLLHALEKLSNR